MGGQNSKVDVQNAAPEPTLAADDDSPFWGFLDDSFVQIATTIIDSFVTGGSLTCLHELMKFVVKVTLQTAKLISNLKEEIWGNKELYDLVKEFLDNSDATLVFFTELEKRLRRARGNQFILEIALQKFDNGIEDCNSEVNVLSSTLNELRNFLTAGDPFDKGFAGLVQATMDRHEKMSVKLKDRIKALDEKMKREKWWRDFSCGLMGGIAVEYLAVAVFGFCLGIVPLVGAASFGAVAVGATAVGATAYFVHNKIEKAQEKKRETVDVMDRANETTIAELKNIDSLIEILKTKLEEMLKYGEGALSNSEDILELKTATEKLRKPVEDFNKTLESLCGQVDECRDNIIAARKAVLRDKMMSLSQKQQLQPRKHYCKVFKFDVERTAGGP